MKQVVNFFKKKSKRHILFKNGERPFGSMNFVGDPSTATRLGYIYLCEM